jgi:hypothetical protein
VEATIDIKDESIDPAKVVFKTPKGTEFVSKYENGVYTIHLIGGEAGDGQEIYATYKSGNKYLNFGKLTVVSYREQTYKAVIVPVNETDMDITAIRQTLKEIYGPVGIHWEVTEEKGYYYFGENKFFEEKSGLLNSYTPAMREMNADFRDNFKKGDIDPQANYVFILKYSGSTMDRDAAGFMPRGGQFGYIFTKDFQGDAEILQTIAHELGHGKLLLKHTFDKDYGIAQGTTDNLMDYAKGKTHLAKWQWDILADPGIAQGVFDTDQDGMVASNGFYIQETIRLLRIVYINKIKHSFTKSKPTSCENIQIGKNKYTKVKIEQIDKFNDLFRSGSIVFYQNMKITVVNEKEANDLYMFIAGTEKNIYGESDKSVNINGEIITLDKITSQMELIILKLIQENKYNELSHEQKIILNIPTIEWMLGYCYGSAFLYHWLEGLNSGINKNIMISDENFAELFTKSDFFKQEMGSAIQDFEQGNIHNVGLSVKCFEKIKNAILEGRNIKCRIPKDYEAAEQESDDYINFIFSHPVSYKKTANILENSIIPEDFAYAIGSFAIFVIFEGELVTTQKGLRGHLDILSFRYRILDQFDFVGDQRIGNWNGDLFNPQNPHLLFKNTKITNKNFQDLYKTLSGMSPDKDGRTPWDYIVMTKYHYFNTKISIIDYNIDFFNQMKWRVIK